MGVFLLRRIGVMLFTALCLTLAVFFLTNLEPNLEKLTKSEGNMRMSDAEVQSWLEKNGYRQPLLKRYGEWLGVMPGWQRTDSETGKSPVAAYAMRTHLGTFPSIAESYKAIGEGP